MISARHGTMAAPSKEGMPPTTTGRGWGPAVNVQPIATRIQTTSAQGLRAAATGEAEPKDGYRAGQAPLHKKIINSVAWGSGGFLGGVAIYPATRWLAVQASMGLAALGAAGPAFAVLALAETAIPVITVAATTAGAGVLGWRTAGT